MIKIILGLSIVIGTYIKQIILSSFFYYQLNLIGNRITPNTITRIQLLNEINYIIAIIISIVITKKIASRTNLTVKTDGNIILLIGIWLFLISKVIDLTSRLIPHAVYILAKFPITKFFIQDEIPILFSSVFILIGLFSKFLSAKPIEKNIYNNSL